MRPAEKIRTEMTKLTGRTGRSEALRPAGLAGQSCLFRFNFWQFVAEVFWSSRSVVILCLSLRIAHEVFLTIIYHHGLIAFFGPNWS